MVLPETVYFFSFLSPQMETGFTIPYFSIECTLYSYLKYRIPTFYHIHFHEITIQLKRTI